MFLLVFLEGFDNIMNQIFCSNEIYIYIYLYLSICFLILLFFGGGKL